MDLGEAIAVAIESEIGVINIYEKYASQFTSEVGKKIFEALGKEEEDHVAYLRVKLAQWKESGKLSVDSIDTIVPSVDTIKNNVAKLKAVDGQTVADSELEAFKKALEMEINATNFYKDLVSKLSEQDRKLFERFIEIEEGHEAIVRAEIDQARGLGYWFDFMEFDLESA